MTEVDEINLRRTGRTWRQIETAPIGAIFIWPFSRLDYPKDIAAKLGRSDIKIFSTDQLNEPNALRGFVAEIIVDHSVWLSAKHQAVITEYELCRRLWTQND